MKKDLLFRIFFGAFFLVLIIYWYFDAKHEHYSFRTEGKWYLIFLVIIALIIFFVERAKWMARKIIERRAEQARFEAEHRAQNLRRND